MLVLTRRKNQRILIGKDIVITIVEIRPGAVRIGIDAPIAIPVNREEIAEQIAKEEDAKEREWGKPQ